MELVFVRIKDSVYCDQAEPFVNTFADNHKFKLTKYVESKDIPEEYNIGEYPVLFFIKDNTIVGKVKGFSSEEYQLQMYENELEYQNNPSKRPPENK